MANLVIKEELDRQQKFVRMQADAQYDVADDAGTDHLCLPDLTIFNSISSRKAPPKVPKVFLSNHCGFNCAYCGCRASRDQERYCMQPKELARIAVEEAHKNGHGIFVTSAIFRNADYTEELIVETLKHIRGEFGWQGYVHAKIMPGADEGLIEQAGRLANRLSVNIEVAQSSGYDRIAKQKNRDNILTPMYQISRLIRQARAEGRHFATSQTTQLMAGSTGENDKTILTLSDALYRKYGLKRVYYSPFHYQHQAKGYDLDFVTTPAWRTRRLYQADRLMQLYGYKPEEIAPESAPNLAGDMDPKVAFALRNMGQFPLEVNTASYEELLRVPGIGIVYAKRIIRARREMAITHDILKQIGVPMKKSNYFVKCCGKYLGGRAPDRPELLYPLFRENLEENCQQLTFF